MKAHSYRDGIPKKQPNKVGTTSQHFRSGVTILWCRSYLFWLLFWDSVPIIFESFFVTCFCCFFGAKSMEVRFGLSQMIATQCVMKGCLRFARIAGHGAWHAGGTPIAPTHPQMKKVKHTPTKQNGYLLLCA